MALDMTTVWFLVGLFATVGVFDVWLLVKKGRQATISWTLYAAAQRWPVIALAVGILVGHIFWVQGVQKTPNVQVSDPGAAPVAK